MANPPRRFRVDGRLDEPVLQIPPWPDDVVDNPGASAPAPPGRTRLALVRRRVRDGYDRFWTLA